MNSHDEAKVIQKLCREFIFRKRLKELDTLGLGQNLSTEKKESFESFQNTMTSLTSSSHSKNILTKFIHSLNIPKMSIQKLLSIYMIVFYPKDLFPPLTTMTKLENALLQHSKITMKYIHHPTLCKCRKDTAKLVKTFNSLFTYWLHYDKRKQLEELCDIYYNLPKSFTQSIQTTKEEKESYEQQRDQFRKTVREHIKKIAGERGLKLLLEYGEKMKHIENNIAKQVHDTMHNTYWKLFQLSLENSNYSQVIDLLNEIREFFLYIVKNSSSWQSRINEHLDIPYISRRIHTNTFDPPYLRSLICFIFDSLQELGSPLNDASVIECKTKMLQTMHTSKTYSEFLPVLFRNILERLQHLHQSVEILRSIK